MTCFSGLFTKIKKSKKGMTFFEVLIAALIMLPVIVGVLQVYLCTAYYSGLTKEKTIALNALQDMIEAIKCTPYSNIVNDFPDGIDDGTLANDYADLVGSYTLNGEHITVSYQDTSADPLEILATIRWRDIRGRTQTESLSTMRIR